MKKIYIMGDSYGDNSIKSNLKYDSWIDMLSNDYDIMNYSMRGTGPDFILKNIDQKQFQKNSHLLIIFSDIYRLHFDFLKCPSHSTTAKWIYENFGIFLKNKFKKKFNHSDSSLSKKIYLLDYAETIYHSYKNFDFLNFYKDFNKKILNIKQNFDKILIIPVEKNQYLSEDFKISSFNLKQISDLECFIDDNETKLDDIYKSNVCDDLSYRKNHLSQKNHKVLYDYLFNYYSNGLLNHNIEFEKKIFNMNQNIRDFIYE